MFTQFRVRYPKGCLISELLTIEHGKYVVRAMIQVEGVTQATGLAAAETVELAEDQARIRALAVLGIHLTTANDASSFGTVPVPSEPTVSAAELGVSSAVVPPRFAPADTFQAPDEVSATQSAPTVISQPSFSSELSKQAEQIPIFSESFVTNKDVAGLSSREPKLADKSSSSAPPISWDNSVPFGDDFSGGELEIPEESHIYQVETPARISSKATFEEPLSRKDHNDNQSFADSPIAVPPTSTSKFSFGQTQTNMEGTSITSSTEDMSDVINRIDVEMRRVGWSKEQGRDFLIRTYGKRGRSQLTDEQLLDFLHYLEVQPSPE